MLLPPLLGIGVYRKMSTATAIDWSMALEQVHGDQAFLKEILGDFTKESDDAMNNILDGMRSRQFMMVMKAAHQIKGSASYLYCMDIRRCASRLQDLSNEGMSCAEAERHRVWTQIENEHQNLGAYIQLLNQAITMQYGAS